MNFIKKIMQFFFFITKNQMKSIFIIFHPEKNTFRDKIIHLTFSFNIYNINSEYLFTED